MKSIIFFMVIFLFYGCSNTSKINLSSSPNGAKIYDTNTNQYLGKTPLELTYIYDANPKTPKCEVMRPITAIWGKNDAKMTKSDIIICPDKDYKIVIDQIAFSKSKKYKIIDNKQDWSINPYFGVALNSGRIKFNEITTQSTTTSIEEGYMYKFGFIDDEDNRMEINYITYDFNDSDFSLYSLDTIIPFYEDQVRPYFKFGLGYHSYTYNLKDYSSADYNLGLGVLADISDSMEIDLGISNKRHINFSNIAKSIGSDSVASPESKIELKTIVMGINYKF